MSLQTKKILYGLICVGGFAVAFVGLRVISSAMLGIAGILVCIYGLIEVMHYFSDDAGKKSTRTMYAPPPKVITCPHCGATVPAENEFCGKCGKKIAE